jgi:hypothetical protein
MGVSAGACRAVATCRAIAERRRERRGLRLFVPEGYGRPPRGGVFALPKRFCQPMPATPRRADLSAEALAKGEVPLCGDEGRLRLFVPEGYGRPPPGGYLHCRSVFASLCQLPPRPRRLVRQSLGEAGLPRRSPALRDEGGLTYPHLSPIFMGKGKE